MGGLDIVAVIDDDQAVREALGLMLGALDIEVLSYANAREFLGDPRGRDCGCLVLDVRMPGTSGIDLQRRLVEQDWDIPVIFITGHGDVPMAVEAMRRGAVDFLQKPLQEQHFLDSVQRSLAASRERRRQRQQRQTQAARLACLTPREREVLDQLLTGRRSKEIAQLLRISPKTVEEYRSNILRKMHAASTADLLCELSGRLPPAPGGGPAGGQGKLF